MNASVRTATGAMRRRIAIAAINASAPTIAVFFGVWDSSAPGTGVGGVVGPPSLLSEWAPMHLLRNNSVELADAES
jgi:hypothetical protein